MPRLREIPKKNQFQSEPFDSSKADGGTVLVETEEAPFGAPDPVVKEKPEAPPEVDAAAELRKKIEELQKAEGIQRQRADDAERAREAALLAARQRDADVDKYKTEAVQTKSEFLTSAIEKEQEAVASAERDYAIALANGDSEAAAKANTRQNRASAKLIQLEAGKAALDVEIEEAKNAPKPQAQVAESQDINSKIDRLGLPSTAKTWLKAHPEYLTNDLKNSQIGYFHRVVKDQEGLPEFSAAYYESPEKHLGLRKEEVTTEDEEPQERSSMVSAPVSREAPSANGSRQSANIRLTASQREAAKMAGISETEYAKQLQKLQKEKSDGNYGERR